MDFWPSLVWDRVGEDVEKKKFMSRGILTEVEVDEDVGPGSVRDQEELRLWKRRDGEGMAWEQLDGWRPE